MRKLSEAKIYMNKSHQMTNQSYKVVLFRWYFFSKVGFPSFFTDKWRNKCMNLALICDKSFPSIDVLFIYPEKISGFGIVQDLSCRLFTTHLDLLRTSLSQYLSNFGTTSLHVSSWFMLHRCLDSRGVL